LDTIVKATRIVARKSKDVEVCMVGDGPLRSNTIQLVHSYNLTNLFSFTGTLGSSQVAEKLGKASIFILPSLKEGMPFSLLEAMASGLAVVGSNISGINDVVVHGKNGLLVPSSSPEALAEAILTLLKDSNLRRRLGENARNYVVERHSWATQLPKIERFYDEALEKRV